MNTFTVRNFLLSSICVALGGCASHKVMPMYAMPDSMAPSAKVSIAPIYVGRGQDYAAVERSEFDCGTDGAVLATRDSGLAYFERYRDKPVEVALPAGAAHFNAHIVEGDYSCSMKISAVLKAGHAYELTATLHSEGFFTLKVPKCLIGMTDLETKQSLPIVMWDKYTSAGPSACTLRALLQGGAGG